jgi:hypothetical protein
MIEKIMAKKRLLILLFLAVITVILVTIIIKPKKEPTRPEGSIKLNIETIPRDAKITIDQAEYKSPLETFVVPGRYTISYERFGFKTITHELDVSEDYKNIIALEPVTEEAEKWKEKNFNLYEQAYGFAQTMADKSAEKKGDEYPLLLKLPKNTLSFQIGTNGTTIIVHSSDENRHFAIKELKSYRLDLSPYKYQFIDDVDPSREVNPFKESWPNL